MGRLIVIALLVLVAVWAIRRALSASAKRDAPQAKPDGELVRCARCGVHLPAAEARTADGRPFCSEEHARLGPEDAA